MSNVTKYLGAAMVSATCAMVSTAASATVVNVPEPGMVGIVAAGAIAIFVAARLRNKK